MIVATVIIGIVIAGFVVANARIHQSARRPVDNDKLIRLTPSLISRNFETAKGDRPRTARDQRAVIKALGFLPQVAKNLGREFTTFISQKHFGFGLLQVFDSHEAKAGLTIATPISEALHISADDPPLQAESVSIDTDWLTLFVGDSEKGHGIEQW
jgi:hypothetical protein